MVVKDMHHKISNYYFALLTLVRHYFIFLKMQRLEWKMYQAGLETAQCTESLYKGTCIKPRNPSLERSSGKFLYPVPSDVFELMISS